MGVCEGEKDERGDDGQSVGGGEGEGTQKCGPPGLDADTGEGLLRGGARPYGCMAKRDPRGGSGHISLRGGPSATSPALRFGGTHGSTDNDIRLRHHRHDSRTPADTAGERPGGEKSPAPPRQRTVTYATQ